MGLCMSEVVFVQSISDVLYFTSVAVRRVFDSRVSYCICVAVLMQNLPLRVDFESHCVTL